ncbi:ISL3 family transposase [Labrys sp. 22185]|uniref:ISL3 family transposase n=1 Tax=Labrys sp. 22185 TaxID=3453888 RepID=UPI003F84DDF6
MSHASPPPPPPRVLGVDDWAWRRGQRYGTVLMNLESNRIVDLLADRESATLCQWLRMHPGVEIIARDRAGAYAQAAREGTPGAIQVADRWHMLRNCSDALLNVLERRHHLLREIGGSLAGQVSEKPASCPGTLAAERSSKLHRQQDENRARRQALFDKVVDLKAKGWSVLAVQRETGLDRKTIRSWLDNEHPGTWVRKASQAHPADAYAPFLRRRWQEGCRNATQLYREVCRQGYRGQVKNFRHWVRNRLRQPVAATRRVAVPAQQRWRPPSPRQATRLLTALPDNLKTEDRAFVEALCSASSAIATATNLARRFQAMLTKREADLLTPWLADALDSPFASFARGLARDIDAVRAALVMPWSTGPVEGKINKLKLIKRSMYGRAGIDLLRARLIAS